jgi:hypothetical protein
MRTGLNTSASALVGEAAVAALSTKLSQTALDPAVVAVVVERYLLRKHLLTA